VGQEVPFVDAALEQGGAVFGQNPALLD